MSIRSTVLIAAAATLLSGCATTSFKSTWKNPQATSPVEITGKKVVVVATNMPRSVRLGVEEAVSAELNKLGAQAVSSFQLLDEETTKEAAKQKLETEGYDAAWVIRVTDKEQEVYSTPGMYAPYGAYGSYWGWGGGWGMAYAPEVRTNTNIFVETLVYSVKHDQLAWSGLSVTTNPSNIEAFSQELTNIAVAEMKKSGLLK